MCWIKEGAALWAVLGLTGQGGKKEGDDQIDRYIVVGEACMCQNIKVSEIIMKVGEC